MVELRGIISQLREVRVITLNVSNVTVVVFQEIQSEASLMIRCFSFSVEFLAFMWALNLVILESYVPRRAKGHFLL